MPKKRTAELIQCRHFNWRLNRRGAIWWADGRSNIPNPGRHSLGTTDRNEAAGLLAELDRIRGEDLGLVPRSDQSVVPAKPLALAEGRKLYEDHIARPRVTGGVKPSTMKRYRTVFDKFLEFASAERAVVWNAVNASMLTRYAAHLEREGYAYKTQLNELTVLKQAVKWMIDSGHLAGKKPIVLKLRKAECEPAYCYRPDEVRGMVEYCRSQPALHWVGQVIVGLACTGLRISELVSLRWSDIDLENNRLTLSDETGRRLATDPGRRQTKTSHSRSFPLHADLLAVLNELPRVDRYVFHGPRRGRLKPDTVRRVLVREVLQPLAKQFPTPDDEKGFKHGRLHSFRHAFCSTCANSGVPERIVMEWLGHRDSAMTRHYYHLHDAESRRQMDQLNFLGGTAGRSGAAKQVVIGEESTEPSKSQT